MSGTAPTDVRDAADDLIFDRLLDEVYLLMDFVSGRGERALVDLDIRAMRVPDETGKLVPATDVNQVVTHICSLRYPDTSGRGVDPARDAAFLLLVKDELNRLANPATGLTVAYTAMAVSAIEEATSARAAPSRATTRPALAARAYPGLVPSAQWLRFWIRWGLVLLLVLTVATVFTSGVASIGRALLQTVDAANKEMAAANAALRTVEHTRSEPAVVAANGGSSPVFCERPMVRHRRQMLQEVEPVGSSAASPERARRQAQVFDSPAEQDACDQVWEADDRRWIAQADLASYVDHYLWLFDWPVTLASRIREWVVCWSEVQAACYKEASQARFEARLAHRSPEWVADILAGQVSYLLPMCFTILGAAVSIVRDLQDKIRHSLVNPRDLPLAWARFVLGMVAGAAIGLFYAPTDAAGSIAGAAEAGVTLSASGLAFLAGYGVDSVFAAFDRMLRRFTVDQAGASPAPLAPPTAPPTNIAAATPGSA